MRNGQTFNYNQPDPDTLAGVYVEVTDSDPQANTPQVLAVQERLAEVAQAEKLYGLTLSVDDENAPHHLNGAPQAG